MNGDPLGREPELWELAIKLDVLLCYPYKSLMQRQRIAEAIASRLIKISVDSQRSVSNESGKEAREGAGVHYPEYGQAALRRSVLLEQWVAAS